jgi:hypothetical protein
MFEFANWGYGYIIIKIMGNLTTIEFIERAKKYHRNKYDYSKSIYCKCLDKLIISCNIHGDFKQTPNSHLNGQGCPKCGIIKRGNDKILKANKNFKYKANKIHNNKYDYSITNYSSSRNKVEIICFEHGIFEQIASDHLNGHCCPKCSHPSKKLTTEEFIKKANNVHNNVYDYSFVKYINAHKKIKIFCKKHGEFSQKPNSHLCGQGCPFCNNSKGEEKITQFLKKNHIIFEYQKGFDNCKNNKHKLYFDFYLPEKKTLIEYDGIQHYYAFEHFGGNLKLNKIQQNDKIKTEYAINNDLILLRIKYTERNNISEILKNNISV